jgi:PadR family transcriptional regulator, regulatory protein AphA
MSLDHVLLGILRSPASGYEIKQQFDRVFSHFWAADLPQIYRTLNRMERDGLLVASAMASEKGPERRVYRITAGGKRALRKWLTTAPTIATERLEYLAQTFFLGALEDDAAALSFMRELRSAVARELAVLEGIAAGWATEDPTYPDCADRDDFYAQLTLDLGLHKLATKLAWADRCIARIERRIGEGRESQVA